MVYEDVDCTITSYMFKLRKAVKNTMLVYQKPFILFTAAFTLFSPRGETKSPLAVSVEKDVEEGCV